MQVPDFGYSFNQSINKSSINSRNESIKINQTNRINQIRRIRHPNKGSTILIPKKLPKGGDGWMGLQILRRAEEEMTPSRLGCWSSTQQLPRWEKVQREGGTLLPHRTSFGAKQGTKANITQTPKHQQADPAPRPHSGSTSASFRAAHNIPVRLIGSRPAYQGVPARSRDQSESKWGTKGGDRTGGRRREEEERTRYKGGKKKKQKSTMGERSQKQKSTMGERSQVDPGLSQAHMIVSRTHTLEMPLLPQSRHEEAIIM